MPNQTATARTPIAILRVLVVLLLPAVIPTEAINADNRANANQVALLDNYRFDRASVRTRLPKSLREVSGLVAIGATRVALHTDNDARIWTFDTKTQQLDTKLRVSEPIPGDFEGIAQLGNDLLLADSHGSLSRFTQPFLATAPLRTLHHPGFKERCVFEGLAFVGQTATLLLPCKYPRFEAAGLAAANDNLIYIFRQRFKNSSAADIEAGFDIMKIDVSPILEEQYLPRLRPSAIEVLDDRLLILAGKERVLLETSLTGELIAWRRLRWPRHRQAEGLALSPNGALIIADEGRWLGGTITVYQPIDNAGH